MQRLEHRAAQELLEKGGGDALGPFHDLLDLGVGQAQRHRAAVEGQQPSPGSRVGQGDLDGHVDPAGTGRQGRLEQVGAVGGQHEQQVGVGGCAVHRVEQVEQDRAVARAEAAILGDEVDVLEHDHRRLEVTREPAAEPMACSARPVSTSRV